MVLGFIVMTSCPALNEHGLPNSCLLDRVDALGILLFLPFLCYRIIILGRVSKTSETNINAYAEISMLLVLASTVCISFRWTVSSFIVLIGQLTALQLHRVQRSRVLVSSPELLVMWLWRTILECSRAISVPSILNAAVFVTTSAALLSELASCPSCPEGFDDATVFARINMTYLQPMLNLGKSKILSVADMPKIPSSLDAEKCYTKYQKSLVTFKSTSKNRVIFALLKSEKYKVIFLLLVDVLSDITGYITPLILSYFLSALQKYREGSEPAYPAIYFSIGLGAVSMLNSTLRGVYGVMTAIIFQSMRSALIQTVYYKALKLDPGSRQHFDNAKIMNLINVDCSTVQMAYSQVTTLISAPVGLIVCVIQLWFFLGISTLASIPIYLFYVPFISYTTRQLMRRFPEMMAVKDRRTKSTMNIIRNIKSLKLYAWEKPYIDQVLTDRDNELAVQQKYLRYSVSQNTVSTLLDDLVATAVFIAFLYLSGAALTAEIVFPAIAMLSLVSGPLFSLPAAISSLGRAWTSQQRLNELFNSKEEDWRNYHKVASSSPCVCMEKAHVTWSQGGPVALPQVTFTLKPGELCCILGRVGAGKSALIKTLCGQMFVENGTVKISEHLAYCSQEPWLQYKSIRENILFGQNYEKEWYDLVIAACDLSSDLASFSDGDAVEIGEKGIRLSGGQKARVALARAVYSRAQVYLLDDVLSAVDEHVASHLLENLFSPTGVLAGKTIVLATNSSRPLRYASRVVCLKDGDFVYDGPPSSSAIHYFSSATTLKGTSLPPDNFDRLKYLQPFDYPAPTPQPQTYEPEANSRDELFPDTPVLKVFWRYLESAGLDVAGLSVFLILLSVILPNMIMIWLTIWSDKNLSGLYESRWYLTGYLCLSLASALAIFSCYYVYYGVLVIRASRTLHNNMLVRVVRAPMSFFEKTAIGAVMNRFTGDIMGIDNGMPRLLYAFVRSLIGCIVSISIAIFGAPFILIVLVPALIQYNAYRQLFVPCARQMQKLSSSARGPILSFVEESIKGIATVSAFGLRPLFREGYRLRSNYWMHVTFTRSTLRRWLQFRIQVISAILTVSAALILVYLVGYWSIPVGIAGIVLHSIRLSVTRLSWIVQAWTDLEVNSVAAERIFEYSEMQTEAPEHVPNSILPYEWPDEGIVKATNFCTRFHPDQADVLHSINFTINAGEKIGIVGRTGAGKSTLTLALFRIIEKTEGDMVIDGINTAEIGLHDLRSRLSIIPQDAQVFKGTLRSNLDPLGEVDDARLWQVLELCHLKDHFSQNAHTLGLDTPLSEGGGNISRGQAQLICLGRALLRPTKVLVLDEATASVDAETDSLLQQTIRSEFSDRTIITVAHRINTLDNADRILLMEKGCVKEFDTYANLVASKGAFYQLLHAHSSKPT